MYSHCTGIAVFDYLGHCLCLQLNRCPVSQPMSELGLDPSMRSQFNPSHSLPQQPVFLGRRCFAQCKLFREGEEGCCIYTLFRNMYATVPFCMCVCVCEIERYYSCEGIIGVISNTCLPMLVKCHITTHKAWLCMSLVHSSCQINLFPYSGMFYFKTVCKHKLIDWRLDKGSVSRTLHYCRLTQGKEELIQYSFFHRVNFTSNFSVSLSSPHHSLLQSFHLLA